MTLISAILYTIAVILIAMLCGSYILAFRMKPKMTVLSFIFFYLAVLIITSVSAVKLWSLVIYGSHFGIPITWLRPLLLSSASAFLLYTTWKQNA